MLSTALLTLMLVVRARPPVCTAQVEDRAPVSIQQTFDFAKHAASEDEQREIASLIEQLVLIEKPDFGLASTMSGTQFAPVESSRRFTTGLLGINHGVETSAPVRRLAELGPKALPALLKALDDRSESRLVMTHEGGFGAMWHGREVPINPTNAREAAARVEHSEVLKDPSTPTLTQFNDRELIHKHALTRGDIAFVILGQIVGRSYEAARYQPSACMVINSPSHDHAIAEALRAIWDSEDSARMLFDSLVVDSKSPAFGGAPGALLRLSYYFGAESRAMLVQRIDALDVHAVSWQSPGHEEAWRRQVETNGGSVTEILAALAASDDPAVVAAIARAIERSDDVAVLAACVSDSVVQANSELVVKKMERFLAKPPAPSSGPYGHEYELLIAAATLCPDRAPALFKLWLDHDTVNCRSAVIHALARAATPSAWAVEILAPLLEDETETGMKYGPNYDRHPIRVCDEAASVVARQVQDGSFELVGSTPNLDAQIAILERRIRGEVVGPKAVAVVRVFDIAALPKCKPLAEFEIDRIINKIYAISDDNTLYAGYGWSGDTAVIDVAARQLAAVKLIDDWPNDVSAIQPIVADQVLCYHGDKGEIVVRELRTGRELRRLATPFHGGDLNDQGPMHVRGWLDAFVTEDGKWLVAATPDGALHSVDLSTGAHRVVPIPGESIEAAQTPKQLVAVRGTSRFLVPCLDDDVPLRVWDLAAQTIVEVQNVPSDFWRGAWGKFAHHYVNERHELWDLEARKMIPLNLPGQVGILDLLCDPLSATAWIATKDGLVYAIDLNTGTPTAMLTASPSPVGLVRLSLSSDRKRLFFSGDQTEYDSTTRVATKPKTRIAIFPLGGNGH